MDLINYILEIDKAIFKLIHSFSGNIEILDWLGRFFAEDSRIFMGGIFIIGLILIYRNEPKRPMYSVLLAIIIFSLSVITSSVLREAIIRPRPFVALDITPIIEQSIRPSLPSNHAAASFAIAGIYLAFIKRHFKVVFIIACLVALSRVYTGTHYPLDVLVGAVIGFLPGLGLYYNLNTAEQKESPSKKRRTEKDVN